MDKTFKKINIEDELWRRYDECYQSAKYNNEPSAMIVATDRMAALMGVTFDPPGDEYDD